MFVCVVSLINFCIIVQCNFCYNNFAIIDWKVLLYTYFYVKSFELKNVVNLIAIDNIATSNVHKLTNVDTISNKVKLN